MLDRKSELIALVERPNDSAAKAPTLGRRSSGPGSAPSINRGNKQLPASDRIAPALPCRICARTRLWRLPEVTAWWCAACLPCRLPEAEVVWREAGPPALRTDPNATPPSAPASLTLNPGVAHG
jgi:hypothetical protein